MTDDISRKKFCLRKMWNSAFSIFLIATIMHDLVWNGGHSIWLSFTCSSVRMDWEINGTRRGSKSTPRAYASLRHSGLILILSSFHWFPSPCSFGACDCLNFNYLVEHQFGLNEPRQRVILVHSINTNSASVTWENWHALLSTVDHYKIGHTYRISKLFFLFEKQLFDRKSMLRE